MRVASLDPIFCKPVLFSLFFFFGVFNLTLTFFLVNATLLCVKFLASSFRPLKVNL